MMHTLRHILQKDFGRARYLVMTLAGTLLVKAGLLATIELLKKREAVPLILNQLSLWDFDQLDLTVKTQVMLTPCIFVILVADFLALLALITYLLTEDSPVNERAFWRTRPISVVQMFAAKAVFIALAAWPAQIILQITATALAGYPPNRWLEGMDGLIEIQAIFAGVIVLAAVLWKNVFVGLGTLFILFISYVSTFDINERLSPAWSAITLLFTAVVVAWWMYAYRKRRVGFALLAIGCGVLFLLWRAP